MENRIGEETSGCFELFKEWLRENTHYASKSGVYSDALVIWLMAYQRLQEGASLSRAIDEFGDERCWEFAGDCKRSRERHISTNTGGYAQARAKLPVETVKRICDELFLWLNNFCEESNDVRPVYSLDGTTIELLHSKELVKKYRSHTKRGYYPLMRLLVCHDLKTGLALRPEYGAMYGKNRTGEIELSKQMFQRLPKNSIVIGDRNFGIFNTVYCAKNEGIDVVLRLQDHRAKKVLGKSPTHGIDQSVVWTPTPKELSAHPEILASAEIEGRVICMNVKSYDGGKVTPLYLFTTLKDPVETIIEMYGLRWNIEIDLRTLKQTVNMEMLKVNSEHMALKELFVGICAYNLVRTVIRAVANKLGAAPRDFSFKRVLYAVQAYSKFLSQASTSQRKQEIIKRFSQTIESAKHPKRRKRRVEPRALVRRRRQKYPSLKTSRDMARKKIMKKN